MDRSIIAGDMAVQEDVTGNNASDFNYITSFSLSPLSIPFYCAETTWIMNVVSNWNASGHIPLTLKTTPPVSSKAVSSASQFQLDPQA